MRSKLALRCKLVLLGHARLLPKLNTRSPAYPESFARMTPPTVAITRLRRRAILCVLGSSASFAFASALVKFVGGAVPTSEIVFFRNLIAVVCMVPLIWRSGGWSALHTRRPLGHAWRLIAGLTGMYAAFYGFTTLPLATVTALGFSMPIFLALLSIPRLGEQVGRHRAMALGAGLLGVLIMLRPWQDMAGVQVEGGPAEGVPIVPAMVVMVGVVFWALAMISIRRMGKAGERNITIVMLFTLGGTAVSGLLSIPVWVTPGGWTLAALIGIGVVSAAAQLLMTEGYRSGEATMLAPFEYGAILYTVLLGYLIWNEAPGGWEFAGIAILVGSGLYSWWREGQG